MQAAVGLGLLAVILGGLMLALLSQPTGPRDPTEDPGPVGTAVPGALGRPAPRLAGRRLFPRLPPRSVAMAVRRLLALSIALIAR